MCNVLSRLAVLAALLAASMSLADNASKPFVSLVLTGVSAKRHGQETLFQCEARLENATGQELTVHSNFFSVFDGLELVLTNKDGAILVQQPSTFHQSPVASAGRDFTLKKGITKATLAFPVRALSGNVNEVKVRLVGTLPGSKYTRILSTDTIEVNIRK